jgi:sulfite reductase (NADPH) hemoprotein beta-component
VDVLAHDLGFIAIVEQGRIVGYNVAVGGGMGMTHGETDTYPRAGTVIGYCDAAEVIDVAEKVVTVQRDYGDRSDRKHARVKYTIDRMGLEQFTTLVNERLAVKLQPAREYAFTAMGDRLGWAEEADGTGRIIMTTNQNVIVAEIPPERRAEVAALIAEYGVDAGNVSGLRRNAMACVALPTCGLALAESERYLPDLVTRLEAELERFGLRDDEIVIRMTGCPNGCARPYMAEIALVGRTPGIYNLYLGGAFDGRRLNKLHRRDVDGDAIVAALSPLFEAYARDRLAGERFGDFVIRTGVVQETIAGLDFHDNLAAEVGG